MNKDIPLWPKKLLLSLPKSKIP